jgi:hypothetical protein
MQESKRRLSVCDESTVIKAGTHQKDLAPMDHYFILYHSRS